MKIQLSIVLVVVCSSLSFSNAYRCDCDRINYLLNEEIKHYNLYNYQRTVSDKTVYVLNELNRRINQSYELDHVIVQESKQYAVEIVGLESGVHRLTKLLNHLDERDRHLRNQIDQQEQQHRILLNETQTLQEALETVNQTAIKLTHTVATQNSTINNLKKEIRKLEAKVHRNAASVHGQTGIVTGESELDKNLLLSSNKENKENNERNVESSSTLIEQNSLDPLRHTDSTTTNVPLIDVRMTDSNDTKIKNN